MTPALLLGVLFGAGALLVLTSQPYGRPRPSLADRLEALRSGPAKPAQPRARAFRMAVLEQALRPLVERAGGSMISFARAIGLDLAETEARLRLTGDVGGLGLFLGQKLATALIVLAIVPVASSLGTIPRLPGWLWATSGLAAFLLPDTALRAKAERARRELREGLARFADLASLGVSAGLGLESAVDEASRSSEGRFFDELRRSLREARLRGEPASAAIAVFASEFRIQDAEPLASALAAAESQGIPVSQVLRVQARAIRERRRLELVEAGERARVRMYLPVGLLILPAFFVVVFYPAAVQLLQVTAR